MESTEQKNHLPWKIVAGVVAVVLVLGGGFALWSNNDRGEYIDGNVLNLPYINIWDEEAGLDTPWKNAAFHTGLMFRNLFVADSTFQSVEVDLLKSYSVSDSGLVYTFVLQDDLYWSDGEPLTMADVKYSIEAAMQTQYANGIYLTAFAEIVGADNFMENPELGLSGLSVSGNTMTMTLIEPYPSMLQVLAQFAILPEHCFEGVDAASIHLDDYWKDPVVSDMYMVGEVDSEAKTIRLVRNPYYSGTAPKIDEVLIHTNYKFANLDYYSTNNITEMINYRSMRDLEEHKVDVLFYRYFIFNMEGDDGNQNQAMQDVNVRKAIAMAIDRDSLMYDVYLDSGTLIDSGVPRSHDAYNGVENTYDPEGAMALLAQTEYDMSRPLVLAYYYTDSVSQSFMEEVAEDLEAVGFTVELHQCLAGTELYDEREYDLALKGLSAFDISEWYIEYTAGNANLSKVFGGETVFEDVVYQLTHATDDDSRQETLLELQALEGASMFKIPLFTLGQVVYLNEERVSLPNGVTFGNTWYVYDVDFENWSILKE